MEDLKKVVDGLDEDDGFIKKTLALVLHHHGLN